MTRRKCLALPMALNFDDRGMLYTPGEKPCTCI